MTERELDHYWALRAANRFDEARLYAQAHRVPSWWCQGVPGCPQSPVVDVHRASGGVQWACDAHRARVAGR